MNIKKASNLMTRYTLGGVADPVSVRGYLLSPTIPYPYSHWYWMSLPQLGDLLDSEDPVYEYGYLLGDQPPIMVEIEIEIVDEYNECGPGIRTVTYVPAEWGRKLLSIFAC